MTDASKGITHHIQLVSRNGETPPNIMVWADTIEGDESMAGNSTTTLTLKLDGKTVARFPSRLVAGWWTEDSPQQQSLG